MTTVNGQRPLVSEFGLYWSMSSILSFQLNTVDMEHYGIYHVHLNVVLNVNIYVYKSTVSGMLSITVKNKLVTISRRAFKQLGTAMHMLATSVGKL
jgi:Flp pilus assembly secretin CpaC